MYSVRQGEDQGSEASSSSSSQHQHTSSWDDASTMMTASQEELDLEKRGLMRDDDDHRQQAVRQEASNLCLTPDLIRDVIIGLSDGLTVPFALTAGLSGLDNAKIVVIGGLAELVSGAISMGVGGMLSAQAELDHYRYTQRQTASRVQREKNPENLFTEVETIFESMGVSAETSRRVAEELYNVEQHDSFRRQQEGKSSQQSRGLTPLLLRLGEGLESVEENRVWQSALTIGMSYFLGGFIPLLPYLFFSQVSTALYASITITAITLILFGIVKQKCTGLGDSLSLAKSALSTLAVGAIAAGSSWAIVRAIEG